MLKVVIADDHSIVRTGVSALIGYETDIQVIGEAEDGLSAYDLIENLKPDVAVLDTMMPGLNGVEVARHIRQRNLGTKVLILSMYSDEIFVKEALRNGATGYVLKTEASEKLIDAIREVAHGRRYLSKNVSDRVIDAYIEKAESTQLDVYDTLTLREREVLQLAAEGHTNAAIAQKLSISPRTVEGHRANLMKKLGFSSQSDLVRYAVKRCLVNVDS